LQVFVGASWRDDQQVEVAPDGSVRVSRTAGEHPTGPADTNPYKGLEAFNEADADRFFGREAVVERLSRRYRELAQPAAGAAPLALLPIIGPSGCGKSSLARAGLLPELARQPVPGLSDPRIAVLVPGSHPIDALAAVLARVATGDPLPARQQKDFVD